MEKEKNSIGLSRDFIIHPGETIAEVLENRDMSQRELAIRTGMTEKHVSTVIHGKKNISAAFARKLEYALGIESSFWMNLQSNYDQELLEFEELHNITDEELNILKNLKEVSETWASFGWLDAESNPAAMVLDYRMMLGISNLIDIPKISYAAAYRVQRNRKSIDPYVLYAWQRMCELLTENAKTVDDVDVGMLRSSIPEIKKTMFMREDLIQARLSEIFSKCGIAFRVVPNFAGAPVQGFIKRTGENALILCVTLRQKFADIFWFTLFHEIAHILNGDTKREFIDFDSVPGDMELKADSVAGELLINQQEYDAFLSNEGYKNQKQLEQFAISQNVKDYIVRGRLMKEKLIPWSARPRYKWG